jgi:1,4-alpha-glucan branching enzyme
VIITSKEFDALLKAKHPQPHAVLGMHPINEGEKVGVVVRALLRDAETCEVVDIQSKPERRFPLQKIDEMGLFEGFVPGDEKVFRYQLRTFQKNGEIKQFHDPYSFLPTMGDVDLHLFNEGKDQKVYEKLGSHFKTVNGINGVAFTVWAPSAKRVSVVGDFSAWDGRYFPMRSLGASGVWELFIPASCGMAEGVKYKYELIGADGQIRLKTDPYATYYEAPPHNASILFDTRNYRWHDDAWLKKRATIDWKKSPVSIYEVHLGSWKRKVEEGNRPLTYREIAAELIPYMKEMGFTHVEFLPVSEHPFAGSWGYQVTGFFAPTQRYGSPNDFQFLVDELHKNDIGVIIDWVPAHFPRDTFALADFDGTHLYNHADPRQGAHSDWGTLIFNYGRHEVRGFLTASALSWFDRYHIDGMRVDAVASMLYLDYSRKEGEWIPNKYGGKENLEALEFLRDTNDLIHKNYPGAMMVAEESTSWSGVTRPTSEEGGLGFDYKWNMGWMHDTLVYFSKDPIHRKWHQNDLTFGMIYQHSEAFIQIFSHDEVVHGKGSMIMKMGSWYMNEKAQTLRALYALMWLWPGKKALFMGSEFGQSNEWKYDGSLDWHLTQFKEHAGVQKIVKDLNHLYASDPTIYRHDLEREGFHWVNCTDADSSVISFLRRGDKPEEVYLVVGHYTPNLRKSYRVGVPFEGFWEEKLNSAADVYGGSGQGNAGGVQTKVPEKDWDGQPYYVELILPPNSTLVFKYKIGSAPKKLEVKSDEKAETKTVVKSEKPDKQEPKK